jgi:hypothetical protein
MKKIYWFCFFTIFISIGNSLQAAWVVAYSMTPSVPGYTAVVGGNNIPDLGAGSDATVTPALPIGFTFNFDGTNYTQFQATDNGELIFGNSAAPTGYGNAGFSETMPNDLSDNGTAVRPFLAPLWDDMASTNSGGSACYLTTGISPNRLLTMQWTKVSWKYTTGTFQIAFQVVLHETSNVIDFIYSTTGTTALTNSPSGCPGSNCVSASIGLGAIAGATYYSLSDCTGAPTVSTAVNTQNIGQNLVKPANGQMYRWTPTGGMPIELISFAGHAEGNVNVLDWTAATQTNNHYFTLLRSQDGTSFSEVTRVDGAGTTSEMISYTKTDEHPFPEITYYQLKWTDYNGVTDYSRTIAISSSLNDPTFLFPNPASTIVNVGILSEPTYFSILDPEGKIIRTGELEKNESVIDVTGIANGIYFLILGDKRYKIVIGNK